LTKQYRINLEGVTNMFKQKSSEPEHGVGAFHPDEVIKANRPPINRKGEQPMFHCASCDYVAPLGQEAHRHNWPAKVREAWEKGQRALAEQKARERAPRKCSLCETAFTGQHYCTGGDVGVVKNTHADALMAAKLRDLGVEVPAQSSPDKPEPKPQRFIPFSEMTPKDHEGVVLTKHAVEAGAAQAAGAKLEADLAVIQNRP
jgi:hypothetical protein